MGLIKHRELSFALVLIWLVYQSATIGGAPTEVEEITRTREEFANWLNSSSVTNGAPLWDSKRLSGTERYVSIGFQRGLAALKDAKVSDFDKPMLLIAKFHETDDKQVQLGLFWLASNGTTIGVYIQDGCGNVIASGDIETAFEKESLLQIGAVFVAVDSAETPTPKLTLSVNDLRRELRVGLVQKDGSRTKSIVAFVAETLRTSVKTNRSK